MDYRLVKKIMAVEESGKRVAIKTWSRNSMISPEFVGHTFKVHNGRKFIPVYPSVCDGEHGRPQVGRVFFHPVVQGSHVQEKEITDMEARALLRNVPIAPRKVRPMASLIRGKRVDHALHVLRFQPSPHAQRVEQLLLSVLANWENKYPEASLEKTVLYVKELRVDLGKSLKRIRPAPHGRAHRIRKRYHHVWVVVGALDKEEGKSAKEKDK